MSIHVDSNQLSTIKTFNKIKLHRKPLTLNYGAITPKLNPKPQTFELASLSFTYNILK